MMTRDTGTKNTVPVGMTPIPYPSWDEHRDAIRYDAEARRKLVAERSPGRTSAKV